MKPDKTSTLKSNPAPESTDAKENIPKQEHKSLTRRWSEMTRQRLVMESCDAVTAVFCALRRPSLQFTDKDGRRHSYLTDLLKSNGLSPNRSLLHHDLCLQIAGTAYHIRALAWDFARHSAIVVLPGSFSLNALKQYAVLTAAAMRHQALYLEDSPLDYDSAPLRVVILLPKKKDDSALTDEELLLCGREVCLDISAQDTDEAIRRLLCQDITQGERIRRTLGKMDRSRNQLREDKHQIMQRMISQKVNRLEGKYLCYELTGSRLRRSTNFERLAKRWPEAYADCVSEIKTPQGLKVKSLRGGGGGVKA